MRKILSVLLAAIFILSMSGCAAGDTGSTTAPAEHIKAEIVIRDYGTMIVELYPEAAPITVDNFVKLADSGFYDGLKFHRIIEKFMIQGGDPTYAGREKADTIKGEFSENGVKNDLQHTRGAISMARTAVDYNSASSQFFICVADSRAACDGKYACFGYVIDGVQVLDKVVAYAAARDANGVVQDESKMPVIESIRILR